MSPQTLEGSRWCKIAHQESESPMTLSGCMFSFIWYNCLASRLPGRWIPRGLFHPDHQYISADHNWFCVPSSPVTGLDEFVLSWTQTVTTEDIYVLARYYKGKKTLGKGGVKITCGSWTQTISWAQTVQSNICSSTCKIICFLILHKKGWIIGVVLKAWNTSVHEEWVEHADSVR